MNTVTFDVIGDLFLDINDSFNWENKQTSLYCIVTGNISKHSVVVKNVLSHLNTLYKGVFYINGYLELDDFSSIVKKNNEMQKICNSLSNVLFLNNYVVVIDDIALIGINNWYNSEQNITIDKPLYDKLYHKYSTNDKFYINMTVNELNHHDNIKTVIFVTSSPPSNLPIYKFINTKFDIYDYMTTSNISKKVKYYLFGGLEYDVEIDQHDATYISNPRKEKNPYWAKRIEIN